MTYIDNDGLRSVVDGLGVVGPHVRLLSQIDVAGNQAGTHAYSTTRFRVDFLVLQHMKVIGRNTTKILAFTKLNL